MQATRERNEIELGFYGVNPKKFALWMGMVSMSMLFAAFISAIMVKEADYVHWKKFELPSMFTISTLVVIASSLVFHFAYRCYCKAQFGMFRAMLWLSLATALGFLACQWLGWQQVMNLGFFMDGNPSGSFIYVISGVHAVHLIGGIVCLLLALFMAYRHADNSAFEGAGIANANRQLNLELLLTFWHYVGAVWMVLFLVFKIYY